ncbi:DUF3618 domain-containing protein [Streptomyces sp. NPDC004111]|uniref:DUF3618 domain-containing protein n=1 Tax=Streptomyces sp. NPDC004111 TaxID=3364690 RepID=UPI003694363E
MTQSPHDGTSRPHEGGDAASPEELRERIEQTRAELGETVQALAARADVKARAQEKAAEVKEQAGELTTRAVDPVLRGTARSAELLRDNRELLVALSCVAAAVWVARRR